MDEKFGIFEILHITISPGKIDVVEEALSGALNDKKLFNDAKAPYVDLSKVINCFDDDHFLRLVVQTLNDKCSSSTKKKSKPERLNPSFSIDEIRQLYKRKVCVPQKALSSI